MASRPENYVLLVEELRLHLRACPICETDLLEYHRLFGGHCYGQFVQTARLTCPDKAVKSLHAVFAREGRADEPVSYEAIRRTTRAARSRP